MRATTTFPTPNRVTSFLATCLPEQYLFTGFDGLCPRGAGEFHEDGPAHLVWMTRQLESIFGELGITQYLGIFVDQGFDTWETILDITESDLDALGVKLGHRRKLQRRIANFRGLAPDASLLSPTAQPSGEEPKIEPPVSAIKIEPHDVTTVAVAKRKYRRHPKPDENAPERPPSAYVLFSNKMRDDLKGRNLTFTEIAKLVGENWQNLSVAEKEPYESQAQAAKDRYNNQSADYKKTPMYKRYQEYLEEFKARYAHQSKDKDGTKRVKLSSPGDSHCDSKTSLNQVGLSRSGSGSPGVDARIGEEQAYRGHNRLGSVMSVTESQISTTPAFHHSSFDDAVHSPVSHTPDRRSLERSPIAAGSPRDTGIGHRQPSARHDDHHTELNGAPRLLPSLSDVFDPRGPLSSGHTSHASQASHDSNGFPFPRSYTGESVGSAPGLVDSERKPPGLKKELSSAGSISSASSYSFPRTPVEGSLPIHSLLSEKPLQGFGSSSQYHSNPILSDHKSPFLQRQPLDGTMIPHTNGFNSISTTVHIPQQSVAFTMPQNSFKEQRKTNGSTPKPESNLDGMSALLRAGEIVDRRSR